jgi:ADP-heptose:LPS heptosyltransferase
MIKMIENSLNQIKEKHKRQVEEDFEKYKNEPEESRGKKYTTLRNARQEFLINITDEIKDAKVFADMTDVKIYQHWECIDEIQQIAFYKNSEYVSYVLWRYEAHGDQKEEYMFENAQQVNLIEEDWQTVKEYIMLKK